MNKAMTTVAVCMTCIAGAVAAGDCRAESEYDFRKRLEVVHRADRRDPGAKCAVDEIELTNGVAICPVGGERGGLMERAAVDFQDYLRVSMKVDAIVRREGPAPLFILSKDAEGILKAFENCESRSRNE